MEGKIKRSYYWHRVNSDLITISCQKTFHAKIKQEKNKCLKFLISPPNQPPGATLVSYIYKSVNTTLIGPEDSKSFRKILGIKRENKIKVP